LPLWLVGSLGLMGIGIGLSAGWLQPSVPHRTGDQIAAEALTMPFQLAGGNRCGIAVKVTPIRFFWIQIILHSYTVESFAITSLKLGGTNAGSSTSMAAPSGEMFRTTQLITEPPDDT
jgi:hypothetical protein